MEREASFLRCSKLSCYAEFNRMVQVIARVGGGGSGLNELQSATGGTGTSAEYQFYYTLTAMLREVVGNTHPATQKKDLQRVYNWYCLNKPIIKAKTKPGLSKPILSMKVTSLRAVNREPAELSRPQTAPALLCQEKTMTSSSPRPTFTSTYISRSMMSEMRITSPGPPFDELQATHSVLATKKIRPKSSGSVSKSTQSKGDYERKPLNVVEFPSAETFSIPHNQERPRPATVPTVVSCEELFNLTTGVASGMVIDRETRHIRERFKRKYLTAQQGARHSSPRLPVPPPVDRPQTTTVVITRQARGTTQKHADQTPAQSHSQTAEKESTQSPEKSKSFLLQGKTMSSEMETIPEEDPSPVSLVQTHPTKDVKSDQETTQEKSNRHDQAVLDVSSSRSPPVSKSGIQEAHSRTSLDGQEKIDSKTKLPSDSELNRPLIMSATVTLKTQQSLLEQRTKCQKPTNKRSRVTAEVKITTLDFLENNQIISRSHGKNPRGQIYKTSRRQSRPNTVHSCKTDYTSLAK